MYTDYYFKEGIKIRKGLINVQGWLEETNYVSQNITRKLHFILVYKKDREINFSVSFIIINKELNKEEIEKTAI